MTSNLWRTILSTLGGMSALFPLLLGILGCVAIATGYDCSGSPLPPKIVAFLPPLLIGLSYLVKFGDGSTFISSGTDIFRTLTSVAAFVITLASAIFGCATDVVTGMLVCSVGWLSPTVTGVIAAVLMLLNQGVKASDGTGLKAPVKT